MPPGKIFLKTFWDASIEYAIICLELGLENSREPRECT